MDSTASPETSTERIRYRRFVWDCGLFVPTLRECLSEAADWFTLMTTATSRSVSTLRIYQMETRNRRANKPAPANPGIASQLNGGHHRRGVAEPERSAEIVR